MRRRGFEQWAGLGGVAYVILFIGGAVLAFSGTPGGDDAPAKVISYYKDSGHRDRINFGWLAVVVGVFFFIWFLGALRQLLRRIDGDGLLTTVATVGGAIYAALTLAGIALYGAITTMSDDTYHHQVFPELIHAANDAGYVIHASGGVGIGALMISASIAANRAALIPRWLGWVGVVSGVLGVFSIFFFPQFLVALWILVAGILLFRSTPAAAAAPPPVT